MKMNRNKLIEKLLGLEITTRFISIKEAVGVGCRGDMALLEGALHRPMLLAIDGVSDIEVLADGLREALSNAGFMQHADAVSTLFLEKNRNEPKAP